MYKQDYCMKEVCCNPAIFFCAGVLSPVAGKHGLIVQREQPVSVSGDLPWPARGLAW